MPVIYDSAVTMCIDNPCFLTKFTQSRLAKVCVLNQKIMPSPFNNSRTRDQIISFSKTYVRASPYYSSIMQIFRFCLLCSSREPTNTSRPMCCNNIISSYCVHQMNVLKMQENVRSRPLFEASSCHYLLPLVSRLLPPRENKL